MDGQPQPFGFAAVKSFLNFRLTAALSYRCARYELKLATCYDAYRGLAPVKCEKIHEDFIECLTLYKRHTRVKYLQDERKRQYKNGDIDEKYVPHSLEPY